MSMFRRFDNNKLRETRIERGLTIDQLVKRADGKFTRGAVSSWETGRYQPTDDNIEELLKTLLCAWEDISTASFAPAPSEVGTEKVLT